MILTLLPRLTKDVAFMPLIQPSLSSALRLQAYAQKTLLPAPDADPEGWHSLPALTLKGKIFGDRDVEVTYVVGVSFPCLTQNNNLTISDSTAVPSKARKAILQYNAAS